jgi:hypothetical protein
VDSIRNLGVARKRRSLQASESLSHSLQKVKRFRVALRKRGEFGVMTVGTIKKIFIVNNKLRFPPQHKITLDNEAGNGYMQFYQRF